MFIGHFGVALAAKKWAPQTSLGTLFLAQQWADALWPLLVLAGIEQVRIVPGITRANPLDLAYYPYSHSLLMLVVWGLLFGGVYFVARGKNEAARRGAVVCGLMVLSHWLLDCVVHRPDMPLAPGLDVKLGLGIWYSLPATIVVELGLFLAGLFLYMRERPARDRIGTLALLALVVILAGGWLASLFGPPPPSVKAMAYSSLGGWILLPLAVWADRHRGQSQI